MQHTGILRSWNDERGFGFIAPTHGGAELFVHFSAFPRDGTRPTPGERLSYELGPGRDGRPQAVKVVRSALGEAREPKTAAPLHGQRHRQGSGRDQGLVRDHGHSHSHEQQHRARRSSGLGVLALAGLLIVGGSWAYQRFKASQQDPPPAELSGSSVAPGVEAPHPRWRCDGRTHCSQMTSCAEATWFIQNCPDTEMDGDHDGVPCEQQLCRSPISR